MSPEEIKDKVKALYELRPGIGREEAARIIGVSGVTLSKYRVELGIESKRRGLTRSEISLICDMRRNGASFKEIARKINRTTASITQGLYRAGVRATKRGSEHDVNVINRCTVRYECLTPAMELFEKTKANLMLIKRWSAENVKAIYQ